MFFKPLNVILNILLGICSIFVILWIFDPIRLFLIEKTIFTVDSYIYIVSAIIVLLDGLLIGIQKNIHQINVQLNKTKNSIIKKGVSEIYPYINAELTKANLKTNTLDVIGLTLYTAWPQLKPWLKESKEKEWNVRFFILNPDYISNNPMFMSTWSSKAQNIIDEITEFIVTHTNYDSKVNIQLITYSNLPNIHGFNINNSVYISYTHWNENGIIDDPHTFYEYIDVNDMTDRAVSYRAYFKNVVHYYEKQDIISTSNISKNKHLIGTNP